MHDHQRKADSGAVLLAVAAALLLVVIGLVFVGGYGILVMRAREARRFDAAARNLALAEVAREQSRFAGLRVTEQDDPPPFVINVGADGQISIDDQPVNLKEFVEQFGRNDQPVPPVEIRSHPDCKFGRIAEVIGALREVGVEQYNVVPAEAEAAESDDADVSPDPTQ